jgi:hypothetical protein
VLSQDQIICLTAPELNGHTSRGHYLAPRSTTAVFPFNNDPLQILMQSCSGGGGVPDYFTHLRAGGGVMREFARRLDDDGRTSQHPTTLKPGDRNTGYFEEAKQMALRFDQNEAQLGQPLEVRAAAEPAEIRQRLPAGHRQCGDACGRTGAGGSRCARGLGFHYSDLEGIGQRGQRQEPRYHGRGGATAYRVIRDPL